MRPRHEHCQGQGGHADEELRPGSAVSGVPAGVIAEVELGSRGHEIMHADRLAKRLDHVGPLRFWRYLQDEGEEEGLR